MSVNKYMKREGFEFDGKHSHTFNLYYTDEVEFLPPAVEQFREIPGRSGVLDFGTTLNKRIIELDCYVLAKSRSDLMIKTREIAGWLNPTKGVKKLIFDKEPDKFYEVKYSGDTSLETAIKVGMFTLEFVAPDPFAYSVMKNYVTIEDSDTTPVVNNGTFKTKPIIKLKPVDEDVETATVKNDTTGEVMNLGNSDDPIGDIEELEIDCYNMTVKDSDGTNVMYYHKEDFITLEPGSNSIEVENCDIDIEYRDCWI